MKWIGYALLPIAFAAALVQEMRPTFIVQRRGRQFYIRFASVSAMVTWRL